MSILLRERERGSPEAIEKEGRCSNGGVAGHTKNTCKLQAGSQGVKAGSGYVEFDFFREKV